MTEPTKALIAYATQTEPGKTIINFGIGNHSVERWELTDSLADKIEYELATIRMHRRTHSERTKA